LVLVLAGLIGSGIYIGINSKINNDIRLIKDASIIKTNDFHGSKLRSLVMQELHEGEIKPRSRMVEKYISEVVDETRDKLGDDSVIISKRPDKNGFYEYTFKYGIAYFPDLGEEGIAYFK